MRHIIFTILLITNSTVFAECAPGLDEQLADLFKGDFETAAHASHCISSSERIPYGSSSIHTQVIVGDPDYIHKENNETDLYYKSAAGPYWFVFVDDKLIKKDLIWPGRWRGTNEELENLWNQRKGSRYWYMWSDPGNQANPSEVRGDH